MHVGVEATHLAREVRGIGRYVRALLPRMLAARPDLRFTLFVHRTTDITALATALAAGGVDVTRCTIVRASAMRRTPADLYWFPWNVLRYAPREGVFVATIHDVVPVVMPNPRWTAWRSRWRWRRMFAATARRARLILADSAFTGAEVVRVLGVPPARIRVVPLATDDFLPPPVADSDAVLARLGVTTPFFLMVGADERRKNFGLAFDAMARLHAEGFAAQLVQAGPRRHTSHVSASAAPGGAAAPIPSGSAAPRRWLRQVGFVSDTELGELYRRATALVFPSRYEGFGLPVLEAMQLGAPVVCSRAASIPEVGGTAAEYVDPDDAAGLTRALSRMLADESWRAELALAGKAQASRFRWAETARATLAAFDEALASP